MRQWHFEEKVYKRWVVLLICSFDELLAVLRDAEYKYVEEVDRAAGYNFRLSLENSNQTMTIIWMPKFSQAVLAHELVHLIMHTMDKTGVLIHIDNEEALAFYMEYWWGEINRVYKRFPNGRSSREALRYLPAQMLAPKR